MIFDLLVDVASLRDFVIIFVYSYPTDVSALRALVHLVQYF
jgi:hypothetical protein